MGLVGVSPAAVYRVSGKLQRAGRLSNAECNARPTATYVARGADALAGEERSCSPEFGIYADVNGELL